MKFVDIKNDVAFRKIFGNAEKSICLISFLNAVLELEGLNRIKSVEFINPYMLPRVMVEKSSIIDVRATDQMERRFVVEMQVANKKGFEKRVQYYASRDYSMQIERGEDYADLRPTYFIGILDFGIGRGADYVSKHLTIEEETGDNILDDIKYAFIQLNKFSKTEKELNSATDQWTYFIKNAENLNVIPDFVNEEGLLTAFKEADRYTWDKEALIDYDNASMRIQDVKGELEFAEEKGIEKGINIGKIQSILGLYRNHVPIAIIAASLNMSEDDILQIIDKNKD